METREIYWNVQGIWVMYLLFAITAIVLGYGVYRNWRLIALGRKADSRTGNTGERVKSLVLHALLQGRVLRDRYSGIMHLLFFSGFIVLSLGTVVVFLEADLGMPVMRGTFYLYFQSLTLDVVGALAIVGILMALFKRYVIRPDRLSTPSRLRDTFNDAFILSLILVILATGFLLEGARIVATGDPWGDWSPVGRATGLVLERLGLDAPALQLLHGGIWWLHLLLAFALIAYVPYSKLRHIFLSPASIYFRRLQHTGSLDTLDMKAAETLGAARFEEFEWKRLLDMGACTECGRCQAVCPAYNTGQPLSPKALVLDLRNRLYSRPGSVVPSRLGPATAATPATQEEEAPAISAATPDALWSCVTCAACMSECPVFIEHVPAVVDMRRYLVMEQADYPELMQEALTSIEARGHPFRGTRFSRTDWCDGLEIRVVGESGPAEWLYWVGCATAFDERCQKIGRAFATVLARAGVDFAILGEEEACTGDVARRVGNEYLYQMMVQQNIQTFQRYGIKRVVTTCPHCFNTLKNEYPRFGAELEVLHHSELIELLIREGALQPTSDGQTQVAFHDSCYLARHNAMSDVPHSVLRSLPGLQVVEPSQSRERTFCCGGGGGHLWFEEVSGSRINHERASQLISTGATTVGSACPFCMIMLSDGVKVRGAEDMRVLDIAELVEQATRPATPALGMPDVGGVSVQTGRE